jgi:hypothetical protein
MTYPRVSGHTHRRILADLELQLISELQSKIFINMIQSLQYKTNIIDSYVFLRGDDAPIYL